MVVLATKCYVDGDARGRALDGMDALIDNAIGGLDVEWEVGVRHDDFVSVTITGDDAVAARNALGEAWGTIGTGFENGETYVGTLESWDEEGIVLDAGERIRISADELGLGPGSPSQVRDRFGLVQHLPLQFIAGEPPRLADAERDRLFGWARGDNGRLNVNSATRGEVRATANRAGHARDIVTVERLGLLEQSVVCAEGTDPPGLLASVGEYLPAELKCVIPG
ncbi:DUF2110 family protein [Haloplanus sp.]|uniref:DUF2110 family protein n=1 Tax=Haloplanus sp. TaxID=1961696 RepID=UPI0026337F5F|nr:DUF2110 family protein [Haloplanus sp.]